MSSSDLHSLHHAIPVEKIRYDEQGLVPAIVQDYLDGTVLMMAWMNQESLQKTLDNWRNLVLESFPSGVVA